jgi:hypothetical protein
MVAEQVYEWYAGSGRPIYLSLTMDQAQTGHHQGECDNDIAALSHDKNVEEALLAIRPDVLRDELREYGAWDEEQLAVHSDNLFRILWIACGDIVERPEEYL